MRELLLLFYSFLVVPCVPHFHFYFHCLSHEIRFWLYYSVRVLQFQKLSHIWHYGRTAKGITELGSAFWYQFLYKVKREIQSSTAASLGHPYRIFLPVQTERIAAERAIGALWAAGSCWGDGGEVSIPNPAAGAGPQLWGAAQNCTA